MALFVSVTFSTDGHQNLGWWRSIVITSGLRSMILCLILTTSNAKWIFERFDLRPCLHGIKSNPPMVIQGVGLSRLLYFCCYLLAFCNYILLFVIIMWCNTHLQITMANLTFCNYIAFCNYNVMQDSPSNYNGKSCNMIEE